MKLLDKIKHCYWQLIPYDYRPGQIWYKTKCFWWYRYSTVKPKTLPHTWVDRSTLLPHCIFQILTDFWEKEVSRDIVDWKGTNHTIDINGIPVNVYDIWKDCYEWWQNYLKIEDKVYDKWHEWAEQYSKLEWIPNKTDEWLTLNIQHTSEETEKEYRRLLKEAQEEERRLEEELLDRMILVIRTHQSMWT